MRGYLVAHIDHHQVAYKAVASRLRVQKGGEIRSYLGAQIGHHQVAYKAVASRLRVQKGGEIRSYLGAQIGHHQVAYKVVASRLQVQVVWVEYISFCAIVTNYNGPLAARTALIDDARHLRWLQNVKLTLCIQI
eukprot:scaffold11048_cov98-Skeletonema_menzelii.AAC.2